MNTTFKKFYLLSVFSALSCKLYLPENLPDRANLSGPAIHRTSHLIGYFMTWIQRTDLVGYFNLIIYPDKE